MSQATIQLLGAVISLVVLLFPIVSSYAAALGAKLESRLPSAMHATLDKVATQAVDAVEQLSTVAVDAGGVAPADRKAAAMQAGTTILSHFGFKTTPAMLATLSTYIEAAVRFLPASGFAGNHEYDPAHVINAPAAAPLPEADPALATVPGSDGPAFTGN